MDKDKVRDWLATISKDRAWLAQQLGTSEGTVNNWFSKVGFKGRALTQIKALMDPADKTAGLEVSFTASEWREIEQAMAATGYKNRSQFYQDAIIEKAKQILIDENLSKVIAPGQQAFKGNKVAEEPTIPFEMEVTPQQAKIIKGKGIKQ